MLHVSRNRDDTRTGDPKRNQKGEDDPIKQQSWDDDDLACPAIFSPPSLGYQVTVAGCCMLALHLHHSFFLLY